MPSASARIIPPPADSASGGGAGGETDGRNARTLRGTVARITYRAPEGGFTILRTEAGAGVKGTHLVEPGVGCEYQWSGQWTSDPRYGWTFSADSALLIQPTTEAGIVAYLVAHAPGVGLATARALWTAFGAETLATAREEPALVAAQIRGIGPERAERIAAALRVAHGSEAAEVALRAILATAGCGSSPRQIQRLLERYGAAAAEVVRENPYRLIREVHGFGWATADAIGRAVGISAGEPRRIRAAVLHLLEAEVEGSGDTYAEVAWLLRSAPELLGGGVQGLEVAREIGALTAEEVEGIGEGGGRGAELVIWVRAASDYERAIGLGVPVAYRARTWAAERAVADALGRLAAPAGAEPATEEEEGAQP